MGVPAILLSADRDGMRVFQSAVRSAQESGTAAFAFDSVSHTVVRHDGAADIELGPQTVLWRFDSARLTDILDLLAPLIDSETPGHQYVDDIRSPAETLVLSVDEYLSGPPNDEFPQLAAPQ